MDKIPAGFLNELERRGAKRALPDREEGWWTLLEIAQAYGATPNSKDFKYIIDGLVEDGTIERRQVYDRKNLTKCIVYRLVEKEGGDDTTI